MQGSEGLELAAFLKDGEAEQIFQEMKPFRQLMMQYECALQEVETKLNVLNTEFSLEYDRNPFETIKTRIKRPLSIYNKMERLGEAITVENIESCLNDVAGIRVICSFPEDIYTIAELISKQDDINVLARKDYIKNPKENGYRSLHLILEIPIFLSNEKKYMKKVEIRKYKRLVRYSAASFVLLFCLSLAAFYSFAWYMPRQQKLRAAEDAYLQRDYIAMIDALRGFEIDDLDRAGKYMLATAYIQGQAVDTFSVRDKENILSKVTYHSNENVLDYWLYLGRLEIREAQEIAMKMSDDQLLLYAYMQELRQLEGDEELSGEEKNNRKQELIKEIEELAGKLGI